MSLLVGPVAGSVGTPASSGSAAITDRGEGYDFAIGSLGFRMAITDQWKYERATAQFRKEQYDASESPGDQSLLGYWTRGQLSFHKGAGQRYAAMGVDADLRYWAGIGANPFIKGEVSLYPKWGAATTNSFTDVSDCRGLPDGTVAVLAANKVTIGALGAAGTAYPAAARNAVAMTAGGGSVFISASDNKVDRVTGGTSTTIYSHTASITEVHYAKDRLFAMDAGGVWYQLAPNPTGALPVAIAAADKVFTATTSGNWSVSDTPGPVLLANGTRIFAVTQNTDGLFPTLSAPIQVADLPIGESVVGMAYYLGFIVLATTRGVRVAVLGDSAVTYGPRLVEWDTSITQSGCARVGESVFVAGDDRVIEVNLSAQVGDGLEFGWAELPPIFSGQSTQGASEVDGKVVAWGANVLQVQQATPVTSGYLDTYHHRFGTLEPKKFHSISVTVGGDGGSVTVSKVTSNGSVVSLYTLPVGQREAEVTLRTDAPVDYLGLRFTLNADGALSPKLLSYQLRALPAPQRQRMIRVPLALHDVERRGTTRAVGRTNGAWQRLRALEELEAQSSIVTYQDFRTGETGQCYIEQVAHEGDTPPGRQGDGFGGTVFVTLRTL